jgi:3-dehydroquinate dehydratase / shikimate dehydrogenase
LEGLFVLDMNRALLCETVTGRTIGDLVAARDEATDADMVEVRLDGVERCDVRKALAGRSRPVIVTCRPTWEGGRFDGAEEDRAVMLNDALDAGADYVDVEWRALAAAGGRGVLDRIVEAHPERVVLSSHDFDGVPSDLQSRAAAMRATGAAVIKIAVAAARLCDTLPLMDIAGTRGDAVVIGMGDAGVPSRLLATRFGSRWTYAGRAVAPGQIPAARMQREYRFHDVGRQTAIYGFTGAAPLASRTPTVLNSAFAAAGLDAVCIPLAAADDDDLHVFSDALGLAGVLKDSDAHHHV